MNNVNDDHHHHAPPFKRGGNRRRGMELASERSVLLLWAMWEPKVGEGS